MHLFMVTQILEVIPILILAGCAIRPILDMPDGYISIFHPIYHLCLESMNCNSVMFLPGN